MVLRGGVVELGYICNLFLVGRIVIVMDFCVAAFEHVGEGVFSVSEEALRGVLERLFVLEAVEQAGLLDDAQGQLAVQSYLECSDEADSFSGLAEEAVESLMCVSG